MPETRLGRQTPTRSLILPYTKTRGKEAADLYAKTGRHAQEWQELLLYDILAENDDPCEEISAFASVSNRLHKFVLFVDTFPYLFSTIFDI